MGTVKKISVSKMICNFCKKEKILCKAHLVPESFFRFMYPDGKVEGDSLLMLKEGAKYPKRRRIGFYDDNILCKECDSFIGKTYDEYGKFVFLDKEPVPVRGVDSPQALVFENVDPVKLKLFILSILWRYSISNMEEIKFLRLPEKFVEKLHAMIKNKDPGTIHDFSVVVCRFDYSGRVKNLNKYFQLPTPNRIQGINYYNLYLPNGYKILIKVDSRSQSEDLLPLTLNLSKPVYVITYEQFENTAEFQKLITNIHNTAHR